MNSWLRTLLISTLGLGLLSSCSSNDVVEEPVSELPEYEASIFPEEIWSHSAGDGVEDYYSQLRPAVRYGKVFVVDRSGLITAFEQNSGDKVWTQDLSKSLSETLAQSKSPRFSAGITAARNKLFIGSETGAFVAVDANSGELLWQTYADGELLSVPTVGEGLVVVHTSSGKLEAFSLEDGQQMWSTTTRMPALTLRGTGAAAFESGGFFVGTADGKIAVVIRSNGQVAWEQAIYTPKGGNEFTRMADVDMKPLIIGETLYAVSFNGNLVAMEARTGRIIWTRKYSSFHELAHSGANLFVVDDFGRIYSVDRRNGLERWSNTELTNRTLTAPAVYDDYVVVGDFEGYLHFIDKRTGVLVGQLQVDSSAIFSQPVTTTDGIYVQTRDGKVAKIALP